MRIGSPHLSSTSGAGWDEEHYITVFTTTDGSVVHVVAKMDEATYNEHAALDMSDDETGATMTKGPLAYNVTFDVTVPDDKADDDEGSAIMDATIVSVEFAGASNDATDPTTV